MDFDKTMNATLTSDDSLPTRGEYLGNFWNKVDWIVIITFGLYILNHYLSVYGLLEASFFENAIFAVGIIVTVFRTLEYLGNFLPGVGPFVAAFVHIFSVMSIFGLMIAMLAVSCATGLSIFICGDEAIMNGTSAECDKYIGNLYGDSPQQFGRCFGSIFLHLIVEPFGKWQSYYSLTPGGAPHYRVV